MATIGQKLKQAREAKRLTLEKVFEATRIRLPYLQALEADDLSSMPSPVQARGYLRNYAEYLGLNFDQLLDEMRAQTSSDEMITPMDSTPVTADSTPEPLPPQEATPLSTDKPARRKKADSKPATDSSPSKPTRRKKAEPKPATNSSLSKPRRERKKVEPEPPEPVIGSQPEIVEPIQGADPEPIIEQVVDETQPDEQPQPDVSDGIWQSWLNRLSSVISTRKNRNEESKTEPENLQPAEVEQISDSEPSDLQPSTEIFKEIGGELRNRREALSLHLGEVEWN
ncbi:MAG TPA: helix-turn-helix domain-containing protein, partial [Anaerolineales bacterium]|nr:helix-turn-helix domain-containing protein [Anaerolineales bacterium]